MEIVLCAVALAVLTACTSAETAMTGSPHGYTGRVDTVWADMQVAPSIIQEGESALHSDYSADGDMADMPGTYSIDVAGNLSATGVPAYWLALARFCLHAPNTKICGGG